MECPVDEIPPPRDLNQHLVSNLIHIRILPEGATCRGGSVEAHLDQLQEEHSGLKSYTKVLDEFLDEEPTATRSSYRSDRASYLTDEVENLEFVLAHHD